MAKLYFRYGAMGSAKTMNLLAVAHNYEQQGKHVYMIKPALDDRFGADLIRSRAGLERKADLCVQPDTVIDLEVLRGIDCVIVDECQFLSEFVVHQLRNITVDMDIPVICYGLRTNFMTRLFEGSKRLMEVADAIEEVKTTCAYCNRKAVFNIKLRQGTACTQGAEIELGAEDLYQPTCCRCFEARIGVDNPLRNRGSHVELWLVRHGETIENASGILSGQIEAKLSPRGIEQAIALKDKLAGVSFDGVYSSSLQRAMDTAHYAGYDNPVAVDELREFCFGDYDGWKIQDVPQDWAKALYAFKDDFVTPNGENIAMVNARASGFVDTLKPGRYLIFAHGGVIRTIAKNLGADRFIQNGTALIIDWTHKEIMGTVE
ncbi:MAG: thymidine kinase [Proteobacteria bacterium]|nr:thymidine kinase [Pseudomonadota bacterium]MBQ9817271.1 thymidine kinase [Pseudomonadota bacterium]